MTKEFSTHPVLITGATGNVGAEIAKNLLARGVPIRLADFDLDRVRRQFGNQVEAVRFAFGDPSSYADTFRGVEKMFLMRPPQITDVQKLMFPAIDAARQAGVRQVVFLSLIGIEQNQRVPHYAVEQYLVASGLDYTFLRASFFMQNLNTQHRDEIRLRAEIDVPVGLGRTSFIDTRDIAAVAAAALTGSGHEKQAYDLTGCEALDYYQVAEQFSNVLGRKVSYRDPNVLGFLWRRLRAGTPLPFALVMAMLYTNTRKGMADTVTGEVERLTGQKPILLKQYIEDYREAWL